MSVVPLREADKAEGSATESARLYAISEVGHYPGIASLDPAVLKEKLVVCSIALVNVLLFKLIASLQTFSAVEVDLKLLFGALFSLMSIGVLWLVCREVTVLVRCQLNAGKFTKEFLAIVALGLLGLSLLWSLVLDFEAVCTGMGYQTLLVVVTAVSLDWFLEARFYQEVAPQAEFSLEQLLGSGRVVREEEQASTGETISATVSAEILPKGSTIVVGADDVIPTDSEIIAGVAEIRERRLTGLTRVRYVGEGDEIGAGSVIVGGSLKCRTLVEFRDGTLSSYAPAVHRVLAGVREEVVSRLNIESIYVGFSIFVAAFAAIFWHQRGYQIDQLADIAAAILLVSLLPRLSFVSSVIKSLVVSGAFMRGAFVSRAETVDRLAELDELLLDYEPNAAPTQSEPVRFELLDDRISRDKLLSIMMVLLSASDHENYQVIIEYLAEQIGKPAMLRPTDLHIYPDKGIAGVVQGAEVSIGSEEFMIERGVQMQTSDLVTPKGDELVNYIALGDDIVGRVWMRRVHFGGAVGLIGVLNRLRLRLGLISPVSAREKLSKVSAEINLEPSDAIVGIDRGRYEKELGLHKRKSAVYFSGNDVQPIRGDSYVSMCVFDPFHCSLNDGDVTLFSGRLQVVGELLKLAKVYRRVSRINILILTFVTAFLLVGAFAAAIDPAATACIVLLAAIGAYLNSWRLSWNMS